MIASIGDERVQRHSLAERTVPGVRRIEPVRQDQVSTLKELAEERNESVGSLVRQAVRMISRLTTLMKKAPGLPGAFQLADISVYLVSNGLANLARVWYNASQHDKSPFLWRRGEMSCQVSKATRSGIGIVAWGGRLVKGGFLVYGWFCMELAEVAAMGKRKPTALAARIQHILVAPRGTSITAAYTRLP